MAPVKPSTRKPRPSRSKTSVAATRKLKSTQSLDLSALDIFPPPFDPPYDSPTESTLHDVLGSNDDDIERTPTSSYIATPSSPLSTPTPSSLEQLVHGNSQYDMGSNGNDKPWNCEYGDCDRAFARKSDLARHMRIHNNERPFACSEKDCGKAFIQRSALTVHIRTHTGEKPHHCTNCMKAFADSSSLARHRRTHSGNRPYSCDVPGCERLFARRVTWQKHHKRQHPSIPFPAKSHLVRNGSMRASKPSSYAIPGPPGPDGRPSYFYSSSDSSGLSHGFAAPHPSEGAAFIFGGGNGHGFTPAFNGRQLPLGSQQQYNTPPHSNSPGHQQTSQYLTVNTPVSATSQYSGGQRSPISPIVAREDGSACDDLGLANTPTGNESFQQAGNSFPRIASGPAVMMGFRSEPTITGPRAVSDTMAIQRSQPYVSNTTWAPGHVGGGFVPSQLALPAGHHLQIQPSFTQSTISTPISTSPAGFIDQLSPHSSQAERFERDSSPDLVDIRATAPSFTFYPPSGPALAMPYTAVDGYNPIHHGPPQFAYAPARPTQLYSAPPTMQRFHSMPQLPHVATTWTDVPAYHGPGGYGAAHSIGGGRSHEDEEWESIQDQMLSREATDDEGDETPEESAQITPVEPTKEGGVSHWGNPMTFPVPPNRIVTQTYTSSDSSLSSSTGLISQPQILYAPPQIFQSYQQPPSSYYPVIRPPQQIYPTPITPSTAHWSHVDGMKQQHTMLDSPAVISNPQQALRHFIQTNPIPPMPMMSRGMNASPSDSVHNITLTTPKTGRSVSQGVLAVGLGIANVHFDDRVKGVDDLNVQEVTTRIEEEDHEEKAYSVAEEDDSDDEFVLGGRKKVVRGKKGKKAGRGRARGGALRVGRK